MCVNLFGDFSMTTSITLAVTTILILHYLSTPPSEETGSMEDHFLPLSSDVYTVHTENQPSTH